MPCYHPVPAYQAGPGALVKLWPPIGTATMSLPCGSCVGCRTARALEWSRRCMHEAGLWTHNCFLTLTYDEEHLPKLGHLDPSALQRFFKRLRKEATVSDRILSNRDFGIRYFACGEYGESSGRPHYHMLLFNCNFADRVRCGKHLDYSSTVRELWPDGHNALGTVTGASANYVAQYSLKKQGEGPGCDADGVVRPGPFLRMSLKPGIGSGWVSQYREDLSGGFLVSDGKPGRIPRAYRKRLELEDPALAELIGWKTYQFGRKAEKDPARLQAGEVIHRARQARFSTRSL